MAIWAQKLGSNEKVFIAGLGRPGQDSSGGGGEGGIPGPEGPPGPAGASAYEIAVQNGFTGTEAEWLASLKGEQGPQGESGGVASFNGRTGAVLPKSGDYTADMVGARPDNWTPTAVDTGAIPADSVQKIQVLTQAEYDALPEKVSTVLYVVKE